MKFLLLFQAWITARFKACYILIQLVIKNKNKYVTFPLKILLSCVLFVIILWDLQIIAKS